MRIVVVDDNPDDRLLAIRALKQEFPDGQFVQVADEPSFNAALDHVPDVFIVDYALPWTTGIDLIDAVTKRRPGVPVIMFTNTGSEEIAARALRHGAADYVIKRRSEFNRLATAVKNVITQARLRARVDALLQEEREARLEAERATRSREEFLATLSHELRTPLQAILGWVTLLRRRAVPPEELQNALEVLERNARAQVRLIEDLLDLSRIAAGKLALDVEIVPLARIVEDVMQEMMPMAASRSIVLLPYVDEYRGVVRVDPARLRQVLHNLLSNAIKFSKEGGKVKLRAYRAGEYVEIAITDEGIGIAPEFVPYLFERFRQGDASTRRRSGGMGIGLSIAKRIVEFHGGDIHAHSEGTGKGATFTVRLPVPEVRHPRPKPQDQAPLPSLKDVRVLLVDDDADGRVVMSRALQTNGASVITAATSAQALELLRAQTPHVLVSDIGMPEEDGYSLIRKVRKLPESCARIPAIALSAFAREEDRKKALTAGFDAHVGKPIDVEQLVRSVGFVLKERGA